MKKIGLLFDVGYRIILAMAALTCLLSYCNVNFNDIAHGPMAIMRPAESSMNEINYDSDITIDTRGIVTHANN